MGSLALLTIPSTEAMQPCQYIWHCICILQITSIFARALAVYCPCYWNLFSTHSQQSLFQINTCTIQRYLLNCSLKIPSLCVSLLDISDLAFCQALCTTNIILNQYKKTHHHTKTNPESSHKNFKPFTELIKTLQSTWTTNTDFPWW